MKYLYNENHHEFSTIGNSENNEMTARLDDWLWGDFIKILIIIVREIINGGNRRDIYNDIDED